MKSERMLADDLAHWARRSILVGLIAAGLCAIGLAFSPQQFFRSYLWAYVYWINIPLGLLGLLMLQHLVGGAWGAVLRGVLEGGARTLPFMALLFAPICLGLYLNRGADLYPWADAKVVSASPLLQHKAVYLNPQAYIVRAIVYFALWSVLSWALNRWSYKQQHGGNPRITRWLAKLSGAGMLVAGFAVTFASIDWVMSLEPLWYSSIFGMIFMSTEFLVGMAFAIILTASLNRYEPLGDVVRPSHFHDCASLLFAFVIMWAYLSFSQFLIIWSGDIVEEIEFYLRRLRGAWGWVAIGLILLQFAIPFVLLLSRDIKRDPRKLIYVAGLILFAQLIHMFWLVKPAFHHEGVALHWLDFTSVLAVGGLWLAVFLWQLRRQPAVLVFERSS